MTAPTARSALLYDTAASLRLLDRELRAFDIGPEAVPAAEVEAAGRDTAAVLDAIDHVQELLDELEAAAADGDAARARSLRADMRGTLFGVVGALRSREAAD